MIYQCDLCPNSYKQPRALKLHNDYTHLGLKLFSCKLCEKSFSDPTPLSQHVKTVHTKAGYHKCNECNKIFSHEPKLNAHIYRSHKNKAEKQTCKYCHALVDKYHMKSHIQTHIDKENKTHNLCFLFYLCDKKQKLNNVCIQSFNFSISF